MKHFNKCVFTALVLSSTIAMAGNSGGGSSCSVPKVKRANPDISGTYTATQNCPLYGENGYKLESSGATNFYILDNHDGTISATSSYFGESYNGIYPGISYSAPNVGNLHVGLVSCTATGNQSTTPTFSSVYGLLADVNTYEIVTLDGAIDANKVVTLSGTSSLTGFEGCDSSPVNPGGRYVQTCSYTLVRTGKLPAGYSACPNGGCGLTVPNP